MGSDRDRYTTEGLPQPGSTILARYRLDQPLARGGMSMVYRARDLFQDRDVALKVLPRKLATPRSHARFLREARLAGLVDHPNVVVTHDAGLMDDGTPYIVMELLEGRSLYHRIRESGPLSLQEAKAILVAVCHGIQAAHEQGVIHRDLKPSNVLVSEDGSVKVIDFGLSKEIHDPAPAITGPTEALGTPSYMSPEQIFADPADPRTDVWGVGVLFYELVTGSEAFPLERCPPGPRADAQVQRTFKAILEGKLVPASTHRTSLPEAVDRVIARALQHVPDDRYQTMTALGEAIASIES